MKHPRRTAVRIASCALALLALTTCAPGPQPALPDDPELRRTSEALAMTLAPRTDVKDTPVQYYRADAWDAELFAPAETDAPLAVVAWGPDGTIPQEAARPVVYVVFSQPMVPLAALEETASGPLEIAPPVAGRYRWLGSRTLSFEPTEPIRGARSFAVTVPAAASSLGGKELGEEFRFTFSTPELDLIDLYPGHPDDGYTGDTRDVPPEAARAITLVFNHEPDPAEVARHLSLTASGREVPFGLRLDSLRSRTLIMEPAELLPENSRIVVSLAPGARAAADQVGRADAASREFHTLLPFGPVERRDPPWGFPRTQGPDDRAVFLAFSHPLDESSVVANLRVSVAVDDLAPHVEVWHRFIRLNGLPLEYGTPYRVTLGAGLADVHGRTLGHPRTVSAEAAPPSRAWVLPDGGPRMLEAQFPPFVAWEHRNLTSGLFHIERTSNPFERMPAARLRPLDLSGAVPNERNVELIDLSPFLLASGTGFVRMAWNLAQPDARGQRPTWGQENLMLQVTDLGITTRIAFNRALVWVSSLSTGKPVAGAVVSMLDSSLAVRKRGRTDGDGLAVIEFAAGEYNELFWTSRGDPVRILVEHERDRAIVRPDWSHDPYRHGIWNVVSPERMGDYHRPPLVFTDRGLYRPGEEVAIRGIDRDWIAGGYRPYVGPYDVTVEDLGSSGPGRASPIVSERGLTSSQGGFWLRFRLPEDAAPGYYQMTYTREGHPHSIYFQVAHFRAAAFSVGLDPAESPVFRGDAIVMRAEASYLAGGPVGEADVSVSWYRQPVGIEIGAESLAAYRFGPTPHWGFDVLSSSETILDADGRARLAFDTSVEAESDAPADPIAAYDRWAEIGVSEPTALRAGAAYRYETEIRVLDAAYQEIAARSSVVVYPTRRVIGALITRDDADPPSPAAAGDALFPRFVEAGSSARAHLVLVDVASASVAAAALEAEVQLIRHGWKVSQQRSAWGRVRTQYEPVAETVWSGSLRLTGGRGSVTFVPEKAGMHTLRITARDAAGRDGLRRLMVTEVPFYATAAEWVRWASDDANGIPIVPDRPVYRPGDTARLLLQSPLPRGRYLLTVEREGILDHRFVDLEGSASVVEVPITQAHVPVIYVAVSASRERTAAPTGFREEDLGKPAGYFGIVALAVSAEDRALQIETVYDREEYGPGDPATVSFRVTRGGRPVAGAEITYLAADRGVLDLIGYRVPDPMQYFYSSDPWRFPLGVVGADSRAMLIDPVVFDVASLPGGDAGKGEEAPGSVRFDFNPLAVFEPALVTDADGRATTSFRFPDNLTTYRATAVAVADDAFGLVDEEVLVTQPLAVRLALPRRLRERDTSQARVLLTNTTGSPQRVTVAFESPGGLLSVHGESRRTVTVRPGVGTTVSFTVAALESGTAELRFRVESDVLSETLVGTLPIDRPLVTEAVTTTGQAAPEAGETVVIPSFLPKGEGSLEIRTGTTRAGDLAPAIRWLTDRRLDLIDQRMDALLPALLFGPVLPALAPDLAWDPGQAAAGLSSIAALQNSDGGIPFVDAAAGTGAGGRAASSPWVSIRYAHLLLLADRRGITPLVSFPTAGHREALERYLLGIANSERMPRFTRAYALWMLSERGVAVAPQRAALARTPEQVGTSELALIVLGEYADIARGAGDREAADRLVRVLDNRIRIEARTVDLFEPFSERFFFDSQVVSLAALQLVQLAAGAHPDMIDRISNTLASRRRHGYWVGGADTAWALIAQAALVEREEAARADLDVEVTLAGRQLLSYRAVGATGRADPGDAQGSAVFPFAAGPLADLDRNRPLPLRLQAQGTGTLYYSATLRYALPQEVLLPRDEGLSVVREVFDLSGTRVEPERLEAGRTYRMRVVLTSPARHNMVALSVPIPSGAEILDPSFVTSGAYLEAGGVIGETWERETAFGRSVTVLAEGTLEIGFLGARFTAFEPVRRVYDGEITLVYPDLAPGRRTVDFLFRAVTPGIYPTPPAVASAIYTPEVFGRSGGELYRIGERR